MYVEGIMCLRLKVVCVKGSMCYVSLCESM